MANSLLTDAELPPFGRLNPADVTPAIRQLLDDNRNAIAALLAGDTADFEGLVEPLEELDHRLRKVWSPVSHLRMVTNDPAWRQAHAEALPLITDYSTELAQNEVLYQRLTALLDKRGDTLSADRRRLVEHSLREFRKAGVGLADADKARFRTLMSELAGLTTRFAQNIQDATDAWSYRTDNRAALAGLPEAVIARAADGNDGYRLGLDMPTYHAVITHADDPALRRRFYEAWVTRASDQGPNAGEFDNRALMEDILARRHEASRLVGYANYADYALDGRMAKSAPEVVGFLADLAVRSKDSAARELADLERHAGRALEVWDVAYFAEKLRESRFGISDESLRPYFPAPAVVAGLFALAQSLYGIRLTRRDGVAVWHEAVEYFDVVDRDDTVIGGFYADLYAREGKQGGAWMDECVVRKSIGGETKNPIGYLVCNFTPPAGSRPSELTHSEVVTLFHEFGHMLHHLLTRVAYPSIAGINGVPWDAVELPSQFMENFAWDHQVIRMISSHVDTGAPLPDDDFERLTSSRRFNAAMAMLRQLEFASFDFRLHAEYEPGSDGTPERILDEVRADVALKPVPEWNRFANSFAHIFAGGYAAGYYSYKWAEVLAADAFTAFDLSAGLDADMAGRFRRSIL
ncbi:MAG: M3 family metallopeptidase, partial [Pseudomonadota bacterium]